MPQHPRDPIWFSDRREAGQRLAARLLRDQVGADVVLAVPRGGVLVAEPVARALGAPLDVLAARKIGVPAQPELAMGAVTRFGAVWNATVLKQLRIPKEAQRRAAAQAQEELGRREAVFRAEREAAPVAGRTVLVVDDGLATGATVAAAVAAVQGAGAAVVVVAVPVAAETAVARIEALGARVVVLSAPAGFSAVGSFYEDFRPVSDEDCLAVLRRVSGAAKGERREA